jgi:hypothetical protein
MGLGCVTATSVEPFISCIVRRLRLPNIKYDLNSGLDWHIETWTQYVRTINFFHIEIVANNEWDILCFAETAANIRLCCQWCMQWRYLGAVVGLFRKSD